MTTIDIDNLEVKHNADMGRFEVQLGDQLGILDMTVKGILTSTFIRAYRMNTADRALRKNWRKRRLILPKLKMPVSFRCAHLYVSMSSVILNINRWSSHSCGIDWGSRIK